MSLLMLLDRRPDPGRLRGAVWRAVEALPRMRQRVVQAPLDLALPRWEDDPTFDLDFHVRRYSEAPVGPDEDELATLFRTVGPIYERPFDESRPLWELIEIDRPEDRHAAGLSAPPLKPDEHPAADASGPTGAEKPVDKAVVDALLAAAVKNGASDIHFRVGDKPCYRINGTLRPVKHPSLTPADGRRVCMHLISDEATRNALDELQEYDASYSLEGSARFRVNFYRQRGSLCCVLRVISGSIPTLESLGLPQQIGKLAEHERGLILVTGATGSGKSSTLAAMIDQINRTRPAHILTIEDPIEFLHSNQRASISQREIGPDTRSFNTALRAALRQDPDVILVGEMRDPETIDIALKAAETGHVVFSTVHTTDATRTIGRLLGVFSPEEQRNVRIRLADNLKGLVSQRLLPRSDGRGRVVAAEIMVSTKSVEECIKDPERTSDLKDVIEKGVHSYGMQSFDQHLTALYRSGQISLEVAKSAATNASDFERALNFSETSAIPEGPGGDALELSEFIE